MSCVNSSNSNYKFIHVNTKFRPNYYITSSSDFTCNFPNTISNIVSLRLDSICIPNTWYLFSSKKKNNVFFIETNDVLGTGKELHQIIIPDGNYSSDQLETFLNDNYFYTSSTSNDLQYVKFSVHPNQLKSVFSVVSGSPPNFGFTLKFAHTELKNLSSGAGWIFGFRYGEYTNIKTYITSESLFDAGGDRYIYFCLDDYNNSSMNPHDICFEEYAINENVLAKIYLTDGKFSINIDDTSNSSNTIVKTRKFKGPIDISKIKVRVLDQFGDVVDLNNMDFSFTLQVCYML